MIEAHMRGLLRPRYTRRDSVAVENSLLRALDFKAKSESLSKIADLEISTFPMVKEESRGKVYDKIINRIRRLSEYETLDFAGSFGRRLGISIEQQKSSGSISLAALCNIMRRHGLLKL